MSAGHELPANMSVFRIVVVFADCGCKILELARTKSGSSKF